MRILKNLWVCLLISLMPSVLLAADKSVRLDQNLKHIIAELPNITGKALLRTGLKNQVVLISFFASWCPPCRKEFKHLNSFAKTYQGKPLKILAINYFEDLGGFKDDGERLERFLFQHKPRFHVVKGNDEIGKKFENVQRIPTVFIFDKSGKKVFHFIHRYKLKKMNPTKSELQEVLSKLLEAPSR
ncbi:MAG: hypothetical protein CMM52_08075 [Rhodospirillaceae bacterium]|nr:hypothetical protein [Rhodospirillaceae bacterium]